MQGWAISKVRNKLMHNFSEFYYEENSDIHNFLTNSGWYTSFKYSTFKMSIRMFSIHVYCYLITVSSFILLKPSRPVIYLMKLVVRSDFYFVVNSDIYNVSTMDWNYWFSGQLISNVVKPI